MYFIKSLQDLHKDLLNTKHSATIKRSFKSPFHPTEFMYMYTFFNTLYNFNWKKSIDKGALESYSEKEMSIKSEKFRFYDMIEFCFCNEKYSPKYFETFKSTALGEFTVQEMIDELDNILPDFIPGGALYYNGERKIEKFKNAVRSVFENHNFIKENIYDIAVFIYGIRCNIFHGVKDFNMMSDIAQKKRLLIYKNMLSAICEMTLYYAHELSPEEY